MVVEDQFKNMQILDLTEHNVTNFSQVEGLIQEGNGRRMMAATSANQFSSRSHAVIIINLK